MRLIVLSLLVLAGAAGILVSASTAATMTKPDPVKVLSCVVTSGRHQGSPASRTYSVIKTNGITIQFVNEGTVSLKEIGFNVNYHGTRQRFTDTGMFTHGVKVQHSYNQFMDLPWAGEAPSSCHVDRVMTAGGTVWHF